MQQLSFMSWISALVWAGYADVVSALQAEADDSGWYDHEAGDYEAEQCERMVEDLSALLGARHQLGPSSASRTGAGVEGTWRWRPMRWSHESRFTFQGRSDYDVKIEAAGSHGAVVRQGRVLCVIRRAESPSEAQEYVAEGGTTEGSWLLLGGRPAVFRAAARYLDTQGL